MAFPPSFLDELRLRVSLVDTVGRRVKLRRAGREHSGLCPFHSEKSPSFTVSDDKGFYHCFGCGAHGDLISFVQETEGLSFPEAVERLAQEAGLELPRQNPQDRQREALRLGLADVNQAAALWFAEQLKTSPGGVARDYLARRGLEAATIAEFGLGYAPPGRTLLKQALIAKGIDEALLVEAGLLIAPEDGAPSYDRFRHRLMFPILDRRGRVIAFGGRALDSAAQAKYLNSPETPLFHKGHSLYNIDKAQVAARANAELIVAEGYMDVIALHDGGFRNAVAPLGTALTEDQLKLLWRLAPEPILCFDGDHAGRRAAHRAAIRALPLLAPGQSLRFALLAAGEDPDSLIRGQGAAAMAAALKATIGLADLLWRELVDSAQIDTPERRAGLEQAARECVHQVADPRLRGFYERDFADRLAGLFGTGASRRPRPRGGRYDPDRHAAKPASNLLKATATARQGLAGGSTLALERVILLLLLNHPHLLSSHFEGLGAAHFASKEIDKAKQTLLSLAATGEGLDSRTARDTLRARGLGGVIDALSRDPSLRGSSFADPALTSARADSGLTHALARLRRVVDLERERAAAEAELATTMGEANKEASEAAYQRLRAIRGELDRGPGLEIDFDGRP